MKLSLIVAISQNGVIGRDGHLPWHLPEDLRRFKKLTMGHHIIMGRATFESLGRCLPGRINVVVTQNPRPAQTGAVVVGSLADALQVAAEDTEPFVIGGARLFEAAEPFVDRVYLTRVLVDVAGDTYFDESRWGFGDSNRWTLRDSSEVQVSAVSQIPFQFYTYQRAVEPARLLPSVSPDIGGGQVRSVP